VSGEKSTCIINSRVVVVFVVFVVVSYRTWSYIRHGHLLSVTVLPGARRRGRPRTAWMDNIKTWTGLSVEELIRMTNDRDKWRKCIHGVANAWIEDG